MRSGSTLERWLVSWGRLGFTDVYHENVRKRGLLGKLYILLIGTPQLGSFANGFYLRRILRQKKFSSILDAGCGDGTFSFYVASKFPHTSILGVDIGEQGLHSSESTLDICTRIQETLQLPNLTFQRMDLRDLGFEDAFDLIYCFDVLEHIAENKEVLARMYRGLKKGGLLIFRLPTQVQQRILGKHMTAEHEKWTAIEHMGQHYDKDSLLVDLREIGYEVISLNYTMGFWGKLSFELSEGMKTYHFPEVLLFAATPLFKALRFIDVHARPSDGDGLLCTCRK